MRNLGETRHTDLYALCRAERGIGRVSATFDLHHDSTSRGKLNDHEFCLKRWTLTANETSLSESVMTFIFRAHGQYICGIGDKVVQVNVRFQTDLRRTQVRLKSWRPEYCSQSSALYN